MNWHAQLFVQYFKVRNKNAKGCPQDTSAPLFCADLGDWCFSSTSSGLQSSGDVKHNAAAPQDP